MPTGICVAGRLFRQAEASPGRASGYPGCREELLGWAGRMREGAVSGEAQAVQNPDDCVRPGAKRRCDPGDPAHVGGTASAAGENVLSPDPPDELTPAEPVGLRARHVGTTRAGNSSGLLARDNHLGSKPRVGSVDPVEAQGVLSRARDQSRQFRHEVQGLEGYRRGPVRNSSEMQVLVPLMAIPRA